MNNHLHAIIICLDLKEDITKYETMLQVSENKLIQKEETIISLKN